jgi:osmotically inducible protein OsmC
LVRCATDAAGISRNHAEAVPLIVSQPFLKVFTMTEKTASVHWEGPGKTGQGQISTETPALERYPYGFASRFEDDRQGTNPEELLAAAHAACFAMAFSFACAKAGFSSTTVDTQARVRLASQGEGFVIDRIALTLKASVPGMDETWFQDVAATAKRECPLSKALASVADISLQATLDPATA